MIEQRWTFICFACGEEYVHTYSHVIGTPAVWADWPPGWGILGGRIYCSRHEIKVDVDGHPATQIRPLSRPPIVMNR